MLISIGDLSPGFVCYKLAQLKGHTESCVCVLLGLVILWVMPWLKRNFQHWLIYVILLHLASSNVKKGSHCKYLCFRNWDNFVSVCCSNRAMWQWERSNTNKIVLFAELSGVLLLLLSFGNTYNSKTYEDSRAVPASTSVCVCVVVVVLGKGCCSHKLERGVHFSWAIV